ncbi:MAG TPA: LLM class flavin-dependent oxidoreductase [Actinomycetes bacterium]|jgi:alkanesulfonate monooxygenase SsuD/methylene tetrahydromethanopterin reductase-like flavin-dependent oxidoreductase (luciferase family)|nr:LLM class flavin-dependent oxidoreductase [Actinomycetes bacterium]
MGNSADGSKDGRAVELGVALAPHADVPERAVELALAADETGLDLVGIGDHPYRPQFLDTWSFLSYLGARTQRIRLMPDVASLPLRPPAMLAKAAASLDVLTGGRVELGLGAGAFWEEIASWGGPVRTAGESVDALAEAVEVMRAIWSGSETVTVEGEWYRLQGAHPGPAPAHRISVWVGAFKPRMLELTGRLADGWLPSFPPMRDEESAAAQAAIDRAARAAGRDPAEIRRAANLAEVEGPVTGWAESLARKAEELGLEAFLVAAEDPETVRRLGEEVAPRLRELTRGMAATARPAGRASP